MIKKLKVGQGLRKTLCEMVANYEQMKELPPATKSTVFVLWKNLFHAISIKKSRKFLKQRSLPIDSASTPFLKSRKTKRMTYIIDSFQLKLELCFEIFE